MVTPTFQSPSVALVPSRGRVSPHDYGRGQSADRTLGWDWKVTAAVLASFPAREVVIAALGTIYAVDSTTEDNANSTLTSRIRAAKHPDGTPVYTLPMVFGLLIFYALCLQCVSTIAVMRRETGTWGWPLFAWAYMSSLGYLGAYLAFTFGSRLPTL